MRWPSRIACAASAALVVLATSLAIRAQERDPLGASRDDGGERIARAGHVSRRARSEARARVEPPVEGSVSVGRHNTGRLLGGREIVESEHVRLKHPNGDQHHGTDELVTLLERSAATVAQQFPGSRLTVGDLSRRRGGRFRPHRSHRSGRDVDVGFYVVDTSGQLVYHDRFVDFRADGTTRANPDWRFDDARNWALVAAMVGQDDAPVQYMFVARWLKQRLLDYAASIGAPQELIDRASAILDQPSRGGRHEDHFHVRIYCPAGDRPRCVDDAPWHAWVARPSAEELAQMRAADSSRRAERARTRRRAEREEARRRERRRARRAAAAAAAATASDTVEEIPGG
ncbi:penicillin-insensitive murein endopeptidase [Sandaracinus amylolyticus]|uniref:Murein endopeptidase n=1 Tax=Sandaracinus amylolyticus TaxID=927083 RepID=A0A0F6SEW1_9BACT|nr:penicillin-insensitive murein endopeptidase [Sandaracinus amylolyticus]AKF05884.1 Murein endopeptidase [Sandaracinus amylolyticus]